MIVSRFPGQLQHRRRRQRRSQLDAFAQIGRLPFDQGNSTTPSRQRKVNALTSPGLILLERCSSLFLRSFCSGPSSSTLRSMASLRDFADDMPARTTPCLPRQGKVNRLGFGSLTSPGPCSSLLSTPAAKASPLALGKRR